MIDRVRKQPPAVEDPDFSDRAYQEKLPLHARSTASQAIKNNIKITELMADKNLILGQQKVSANWCILGDIVFIL